MGTTEIFSFLLTLALIFGLFMAVRSLMLWYWKVDTLVVNQEKQIDLLTAILHKTGQQEKDFDAKIMDAIKAAKQQ